ncbi:MAG: hypothetical protein ACFBSG_01185 [Leptolyngbyaceae cyanobacterium]
MNLLSWSEFKLLNEAASDISVSIHFSTHVAGAEIQQDPIRLKNLLNEAEQKLSNAGMDSADVDSFLSDAYALVENHKFWRYQSQGLALYIANGKTKVYRLPLSFESSVVLSNQFYLKPLLPLFFDNRYFYILALSQNQVRLFQSTHHQISEVELQGMPLSLEEALKYDDPEEQLQFHSSNSQGSQPIYHAQGTAGTDDKVAIRRFLNKVDAGLHQYLKNEEMPLIIASVEYLRPIYQEVNTYPHLMADGIDGNPDVAQPEALREQGWSIVSQLVEKTHEESLNQFFSLEDTQKASSSLSRVLPAAIRGQVDTLFVASGSQIWGTVDPQTGETEIHQEDRPDNHDLLDIAAVQTALKGGKVYLLDDEAMPNSEAAAGIFRYEVPVTA